MNRWIMPWAALAIALAASCAGTETGNPPATIEVLPPLGDFIAPAEADVAYLDRADELGAAHISLDRVEMIPAGACAPLTDDPHASVPNTTLARRVDGVFVPPTGDYCAMRIWPSLAGHDASVPSVLRGHAFALRIVDEAGAERVLVLSDAVAPIVLRPATDSFLFDASQPGALALRVDAAGALSANRYWEEPAETDGSFLFEETSDALFLRRLEATPGLFRLYLVAAASGAPDGGSSGTGGGAAGGSGDAGVQDLGTELAISGR